MPISPRGADLLRAVHDAPGITRADAARVLGIGTGAAAEVVGQLVEAALLAERPAERTGGRGRPTTVLAPHPDGPLVLALSLTHERWLLHAGELGGGSVAERSGEHVGASAARTLVTIARSVAGLRRRFGARVHGIGIAANGTVSGTRMLHSTAPGWRNVDLRAVWPRADVLVVGNDATLAAAAESARGAAVGAEVALHLRLQAGVGGGVVDHGRVLTGAHGLGSEFGHLPFGDPDVTCPCGARGCWGRSVDGSALADLLGRPEPRDPLAFAARVFASAGLDADARAAVEQVAAAFGRGVAGLVNALDPDAVTLGGLGVELLQAAPDALARSYDAGLMATRRGEAPELRPAALGELGPLIGAAELAWDAVWPRL